MNFIFGGTMLGYKAIFEVSWIIDICKKNCWVDAKEDAGKHKHTHDDVIKCKHFPRYWPFVWGIHRSPGNSRHKGQWRGALMFSLIFAWTNSWANNRDAGDLRCHRAHYDVTVMHNRLALISALWTLSIRTNMHRKCRLPIADHLCRW